MRSKKAQDFLFKHGMLPESIVPYEIALKMCEKMRYGLANTDGILPMIPTYLSGEGAIYDGATAIVIDAGGTNFRSALVTFSGGGYKIDRLEKKPMPGISAPVTWDEFISFIADAIMPLTPYSDCIGFCFSYTADIMPDIDGRVVRIDKEVVVTGCEGQYIGASLKAELAKRGVFGKSVVILNDTAAVLLGGSSLLDKSEYGGFIGQVSGTGTNTCCIVPRNDVTKTDGGDGSMIINIESGLFDDVPRGEFDIELDKCSNNPGMKLLEKMTAGVYIGKLVRIMLLAAADEGYISAGVKDALGSLGVFDAALPDMWSCGEGLDTITDNADDASFVRELSLAAFERSALCMCANLTAILMLTGEGKDPAHPVCVCAEGSLVQKSRRYLPMLNAFLKSCAGEQLARHVVIRLGSDTTLLGSAAAAILNK